jgi:hypothetical protein
MVLARIITIARVTTDGLVLNVLFNCAMENTALILQYVLEMEDVLLQMFAYVTTAPLVIIVNLTNVKMLQYVPQLICTTDLQATMASKIMLCWRLIWTFLYTSNLV